MRPTRWTKVAICLSVAALAILAAGRQFAAHAGCRLVRVEESEGRRLLTIEFYGNDLASRYDRSYDLRLRIAGQWQPRVSLGEHVEEVLLITRNRKQFLLTVPSETEACRILQNYRVPPLYFRVDSFLYEHGLTRKFPKLCAGLLKCLPQKPPLRHVESVLEIPSVSPAGTL